MKQLISTFVILFAAVMLYGQLGQIDPLLSPYYNPGPYQVVMDSNMTTSPDILIFRPSTPNDGPYPTVLFQPGANSFTSSYINKHSYDLYWQHLASYGYVIIIMNNTSGGPNSTLFTNMHNWIKTQVNSGTGWLSQYVDLNRFIVSGHSNGGMNATDIIINRPNEIDAIVYMASYPNPGILGMGAQNVSSYNGKAMLMCGSEDETTVPLAGSTNDVARTAYNTKFTSVTCKTWVYLTGVGHGGFGDYNNPDQPVGTLGRDKVTASVRHFLVSFLNSQFRYDATAFNNLTQPASRPNCLGEFGNNCSLVVNVNEDGENFEFGMYPNPVCDVINFKGIEYSTRIRISDMNGRIVAEYILTDASSIDVSDLSAGIYLLHISNHTRSFSKLFQKN